MVVDGEERMAPEAARVRRWALTGQPHELGWLRRRVRDAAARWQLSEDETDRVLIVVNELVANAIDHAKTRYRTTVRCNKRLIRVLVTDHSPSPPQLQPHDLTAARGRGLQMVQEIARRWGWAQHTNGKTVWASIDRAQLAAQLA